MTGLIDISRSDTVALVGLNNPPVNAASFELRIALNQAVRRLDADPAVLVIALYGMGRGFIAGADIREFGQPPRDPLLPEVCITLESCTTPVISVLHGATLGGGLEVALATHGRIALPDVQLGFPEVSLGLLPGAGGTQRAPRLIGIPAALDLITSARRIEAKEALSLGLVDRIEAGTARDVALAMARAVLTGDLRTQPTAARKTVPNPEALDAAANRAARSPLFAPARCVEAVAASTGALFQGLAQERDLFTACMASPQRSGLIHAFFAERAVTKIPEASARPLAIAQVGVVGAGTMGRGIAAALLIAGLPVTLIEPDPVAQIAAQEWIAETLAGAVQRGKLTAEAAETARNGLRTSPDLSALAEVDLVIEAAFEDMGVKSRIFATLDKVCKPGALLATNTSYLDIDEIAAATERPGDVLGLHFFSPAHIMRLLEVVVARHTTPEAVATGFALAKRLRKVAVRAGVCDGFIGNRMLAVTRAEADKMVLDGAHPARIDAALEAAGFAMGPFAVSDLAGLDIGQAGRKRRGEVAPVADALCAQGWLGRKTGRGYYDYADGARLANPELAPILAEVRGDAPSNLTPDDIVTRYLSAMAAEGARLVEDGIALRPIDVDAVQLFGYGFPRHLGGPMHWADTQGLDVLVRAQGTAAPAIWGDLAAKGRKLADLNS